ncbi:hypothetical protein BC941DRAFT_475001 [Chlamydoabsidia padenii]|nr:hypothetical protein BC941DRAFT_475001 [Chlamydoabsidia padenii]
MDDQNKWKLNSMGKIVDNALYQFGKNCTVEHGAHSFILDPMDSTYLHHKVFTEEELKEITSHLLKPLAPLPEDLLDYVNSFSANDCTELRLKLDTRWPWQEHYDIAKARRL